MLIIKRADHAFVGGGTWECVGGKMEFGEDIESALKREIKEEVGLDIQIVKILYVATFQTDPTRQVVIITYHCYSNKSDVLLSEEHSEYQWATIDQLKTLLPQTIIDDFEKNNVFSMMDANNK